MTATSLPTPISRPSASLPSSTGLTPESTERLEASLDAFEHVIGAAAARGPAPTINASMSPQMILALARDRIQDLDQQINVIASQITNASDMASTYNSMLQELQAMQQIATSSDDGVALTATVGSATASGASSRQVSEVQAKLASVGITLGNGEDNLSKESIAAAIESVKTRLSSVNSGNEMAMLNLQELTQQRSAIIQLTSNLLNTMNEAEKAVIGNLR